MKIDMNTVCRGFAIFRSANRATPKDDVSFWSKLKGVFNSSAKLNKKPCSESQGKPVKRYAPPEPYRPNMLPAKISGDNIIAAALNLHIAKHLISAESKKDILPHAKQLEILLKDYMRDPEAFNKQWRSRP